MARPKLRATLQVSENRGGWGRPDQAGTKSVIMRPHSERHGRHRGMSGKDDKQARGRRRRIIVGLQRSTDGTDIAMSMRVGIECVRDGTKLHCKQHQP